MTSRIASSAAIDENRHMNLTVQRQGLLWL